VQVVERNVPREHVVAELVRLGVVLSATAAGYALGDLAHELGGFEDPQTTRLVTSMLGALVGYLLGGVFGRLLVRGVQGATTRLQSVPAVQLVAGSIGGTFGALLGLAISVPVLLLPGQRYTVPVLLLLLVVLIYGGVLLGANRAAELGRYIGIRGRLEVRTPSRGAGVKVVDSSALIDGRIADVARTGYLEGTLVIPRFVITEVERIAADEREHRSALGERGLRTVQVLQDEGLVAVEISEVEIAGVAAVDDRLAALCKDRQGALITTDATLARTAESRGIRVLNPHALADAVRAPVLPGDRLPVTIVREGREPGQGVGYLEDGTMVVIEDGRDRVGDSLMVDVTSIVQTRTGRLLFGSIARDGS
jgi:uncharacterized protein YacL